MVAAADKFHMATTRPAATAARRGQRVPLGPMGWTAGRLLGDHADQPARLRHRLSASLEAGGVTAGDKVSINLEIQAVLQK